MNYFHWIAGCVLGLAWFWRLAEAAVGVPKIADISRPEWDRKPPGNPRVSIIVPACNEEADIEATLTRLLALEYDNYEVIAVDDRSSDQTGAIMERIAAEANRPDGSKSFTSPTFLPAGWASRTPCGARATLPRAIGCCLPMPMFSSSRTLSAAPLSYAESERADHVVLFPRMIMKNPGEKMMIAFFQTLFVFGHRPWKVADPKTKDHMGVGAFNMIRRPVYDALGTYQALRFEVLDDMKLGKVVKNAGYAQRNVFGEDLISIRWAKSAFGVVDNLTKNFFAIMSFQWPRALASCFALAFLNLMPFAGIWLAHGWAKLGYGVALFSMFSIYVGMSRKSDIPPYYFVLHPVSTALFVYTMLRSTFLTLGLGGVRWRGTFYPLDELRKGMV